MASITSCLSAVIFDQYLRLKNRFPNEKRIPLLALNAEKRCKFVKVPAPLDGLWKGQENGMKTGPKIIESYTRNMLK